MRTLDIDTTEALFKLALERKDYSEVMRMVSTIPCCSKVYCTVLYCTVLYCTVLYCTVLYCTARVYHMTVVNT